MSIDQQPKTTEELAADRAALVARHANLQQQIVALMHEQAAVANDLTILDMRIAKAKRAGA